MHINKLEIKSIISTNTHINVYLCINMRINNYNKSMLLIAICFYGVFFSI